MVTAIVKGEILKNEDVEPSVAQVIILLIQS